MAKDKGMIVVGLVIIILLIFIAFRTPTVEKTIINELEKSEDIPTGCSLAFNKAEYQIGETIISTINDGPNQGCDIFVNPEDTGWVFFESVITDSQGVATISGTIDVAGTVLVRAICGDCTTNSERVTIVEPSGICIDTDGGVDYFVKGTCTDSDSSDTDQCPAGDLSDPVEDSFCSEGVCLGIGQLCSTFNAFCYQGECVLNTDDSDGDGFSNGDELDAGSDPFDETDIPQQPPQDCDDRCQTAMGTPGICTGRDLVGATCEGGQFIYLNDYIGDQWCNVNFGPGLSCCCGLDI